MQDKNTNKQH